jgi:hypothetical protein
MFGLSRLTVIQGVNAIAMQALERHASNGIVLVGMAVGKLLADYRRDHADKVPTKVPMGLLSNGRPSPDSDFELALHLLAMKHPIMVGLERSADGIPPLMAYLAVASLPSEKFPDIGWDSALQYAVAESSVRLHRTQQLQDAVNKYTEKETRTKERASVGGIKGARTRKETAIQTGNVVAAAERLGWPASTDGVNKRLSSKFNCSPDHIGRILRKAKSDM